MKAAWLILCLGMLGGCNAPAKQPAVVAASTTSILASSNPAAGSVVSAPVNTLQLHFDPPARLDELLISGPEGTMPTMVHAVGEVADYSVPLGGLGPGNYAVSWKASVGGVAHSGSFSFKAK